MFDGVPNNVGEDCKPTRWARIALHLPVVLIALVPLVFVDACRAKPRQAAPPPEESVARKGGEPIAPEQTLAKNMRVAADRGDRVAQYNLAVMYHDGQGVPQDDAEAFGWFRQAAEREHAGAQYTLGRLFENGVGVSPDTAEAVRWYRKAAEQGHERAQFNLGRMYGQGKGVAQDPFKAYVWLTVAAIGDPQFAEERDRARKRLSPETVLKAQRKAFKLHATVRSR